MTRDQFIAAVQRLGYSPQAAQKKADSVRGMIEYRRKELLEEFERLEADSYGDVLATIQPVGLSRV
ncbi:MAG: hypothetical protein SFU83_12145 [Meiothermus sp.]|nr:hypothetical protein [Meiothermus sp.]